jgi:hypothetical protein
MTRSNRRDEGPDPLIPILARLLKRIRDEAEEFFNATGWNLLATAPPGDVEMEKCGCAALDALGEDSRFREPGEVQEFLYEHDPEAVSEAAFSDPPPESALVDMAALLRDPCRRFDFTLPFPKRSPQGYEGALGGLSDLRMRWIDAGFGYFLHEVTGHVSAPTVRAAVRAAERRVREMIGAALALNMASLGYTGPEKKVVKVKIQIDPNPHSSKKLFLSPESANIVARTFFHTPREVTDLEAAQIKKGNVPAAADRTTRQLTKLISDGSGRGEEIRNAGRLYLGAATTPDLGMCLVYSFMCLEGLLLERSHSDNVQARLTEAVAYRIGTSAKDRQDLRRRIKQVYDLRSRYVHTGNVSEKRGIQVDHIELCRSVLEKEIIDLVAHPAAPPPLALQLPPPPPSEV